MRLKFDIIFNFIRNLFKRLGSLINSLIANQRECLSRNEIFFKVFSYLFLGVMGAVVSISSYEIAKREHDLHVNPLFRITASSNKLTPRGLDTEQLEIFNEGTTLKTFPVFSISTFYRIEIHCPRCPRPKVFFIPVHDFYQGHYETKQLKGKLLSAYVPGNIERFDNLFKECLKNSRNSSYHVDRITAIKIDYRDIENHSGTEYYKLDSKDGILISALEYNDTLLAGRSLLKDISYGFESVTFDVIKDIYVNQYRD